jgi:ATP-dependent RNA helicase DHX29
MTRAFQDADHLQISANSLQVDRKIKYTVEPKSAMAIKLLREQMSGAMSAKLRGRAWSKEQEVWWELGMRCLTVGLWDDVPGVGVVGA